MTESNPPDLDPAVSPPSLSLSLSARVDKVLLPLQQSSLFSALEKRECLSVIAALPALFLMSRSRAVLCVLSVRSSPAAARLPQPTCDLPCGPPAPGLGYKPPLKRLTDSPR
ncbi:hypothetical protein AAFF_G00073420 [Aldrovandia affinis]|uniref:Uncharacterized protein n=1 Tax=Aldrovandia affinis TaxID=143900 RepID=A0AAD7WDF5_9TELE|nr:hypothetical protein AAFF_G00073420 [Aldrovandia affinis]